MSEEPAAKRMKNNDEHPNMRSDVAGPVKEKLMELDQIQHQLDALSEKAAEEILKVEQNFNKKRQPVYEKRKKLTSKIECFWQTAFLNHHLLTTAIPEEQEDLLAALRDLEVQEFDDLRSGFKIIMTFDKNDYFENETITKSYHLQSETPSIEITEIQWKENRKPTERFSDQQSSPTTANLSMFCPRPDVDGSDGTITFLEWLTFAAPPDSDEIAEVIKDDLYINPLQYYIMPDMQEVDEDDLEDFLNEERGVDEIFQNGRPVLKPEESMEHDDLNDETPPEEVLEDEDEEEEEEGADGEDDGDDEEEEEEDGEEEDGEGEDDEVEDQEDQQEEEDSMKVPEGTDEETKQEDATA